MSHSYESYVHNYSQSAETQEHNKYKKKYKKLTRIVKDLVFENAALCDQVAQMQDNLVIVKEERLFLLRKLCQIQGDQDSSNNSKNSLNNSKNSSNNPKNSSNVNQLNSSVPNTNTDGVVVVVPKKRAKKRCSSIDPSSIGEMIPKPKTKRPAKTTRKLVQAIPLDINGRPLFPITLGDLTVYSLGEVVSDRVPYHNEDLIFPVGFCSTRLYASLKNPSIKSLYTCKIIDGGPRPRFEIVSDSDPDQPLVGFSPDECHVKLLTTISPLLCNIPPKGAQFFGIFHPTIQNLIQSSPGTRKLVHYKSQRFEVMKNQTSDRNPIPDDELDPGINFIVLHKTFTFPLLHEIKEEPIE